jgi:peptide deformylase
MAESSNEQNFDGNGQKERLLKDPLTFLKPDEIKKIGLIIDTPTDNILDVFRLCQRMEKLCEESGGIGLAAVQVGIPWNLFIVKGQGCPIINDKYGYFVNCDYFEVTDKKTTLSLEGCLSVRSSDGQLRHFVVERQKNIILNGLLFKNLELVSVNCTLGLEDQSIVFQHEIDHSKQILISDTGKEVFLW